VKLAALLHYTGLDTRLMLSEKAARMGDKAKPLAADRPTALLS
jgi:hypothetical protein